MPIYEWACGKCGFETELLLKLAERETYKETCPKCKSRKYKQKISAPMVVLPQGMTHDAPRKVIGKGISSSKQEARIPINIIDDNPDGSFKITRIGAKKDIDNE